MVQKLVTHKVPLTSLGVLRIARTLAPPPDAKGGVLSGECNGVQGSRGAGTRSCASLRPGRWQRGGQCVQRRKRAAAGAEVHTGGFWTTTPSSGVSRWKVGKVVFGVMRHENPHSTTILANCASDVPQVCPEAHASSGRERRNRRCLVAYSKNCFVLGIRHHHGSQLFAAVMDSWPLFNCW